jgi:hypothetical protein
MNKKLMLSILFTAALIFNVAAGNKLLNYIPANIDGVVSIKIKQIMDVPIFKEKRSTDPKLKEQWTAFEGELKKYGLTVNDMPTQAVIFFSKDKNLNGAVIKTSLSEARFVEILKKEAANRPNLYTTRKLNGKTVYVMNEKLLQDSNKSLKDNGTPALTFITADIAIVSEDKVLDSVINSIKGNTATVNSLMKKSTSVNHDALIWLVFNNKEVAAKTQQPGQRPDMMDGITGIGLSLDFTGAKKRDLGLDAMVSCRDNNAAAGLSMQLQGLIMMGSAMAFKDNPQLGGEIGQAIKIKPNGKSVAIKISVPEALGTKLQKYIETKGNRKSKPHKLKNSRR